MKTLIQNPMWLFLTVSIIMVSIPVWMIILKKLKLKLTTKAGTISPCLNDRRDNTEYLYHIEKIKDSFQMISKLHNQLELKQVDIFTGAFENIEYEIMKKFKEKLIEYCMEKDIELDSGNIDHSQPLVIYQRIIHSITKDNFKNIINYVKDNDLWQYSPEEWGRYKKRNRTKYMNASRDKFTLLYSEKYCIIPIYWHNLNVMRDTEDKIKSIVTKMQEDSREMSIKYHKLELYELGQIEEIEKMYERNNNGSNGVSLPE